MNNPPSQKSGYYCGCGDEVDDLGRCDNEHCNRRGKVNPDQCLYWLAEHWPVYWFAPDSWPQAYKDALAGIAHFKQEKQK